MRTLTARASRNLCNDRTVNPGYQIIEFLLGVFVLLISLMIHNKLIKLVDPVIYPCKRLFVHRRTVFILLF